jgi:hypothetical protein
VEVAIGEKKKREMKEESNQEINKPAFFFSGCLQIPHGRKLLQRVVFAKHHRGARYILLCFSTKQDN